MSVSSRGNDGAPRRSRLWPLFAAPLAVAAFFPLFFSFYSPWVGTTGNLLPNGGFEQDVRSGPLAWSGWGERAVRLEAIGRHGTHGVRLSSSGRSRGRLWFRIAEPTRFDALILDAWYRAEEIEPGPRSWQTGRVIAFFRGPDGKPRWDGSHFACASVGTHGWRRCHGEFPVPEGASSVEVVAQNAGIAGGLVVDDLALRGARRRRGHALVLAAGALGWVLAFGWPMARLRPWRRRWGTLLLVLAALIVLGAVVPPRTFIDAASLPETMVERVAGPAPPAGEGAADSGDPRPAPSPASPDSQGSKRSASGRPARADEPASPAAGAPDGRRGLRERLRGAASSISSTLRGQVIELKKVGHAALFALLALVALACARSGTPRVSAWLVLAAVLVFAAGTESLQFLSLGRQPALRDLAIDAAGAVVGVLVGALAAAASPWAR